MFSLSQPFNAPNSPFSNCSYMSGFSSIAFSKNCAQYKLPSVYVGKYPIAAIDQWTSCMQPFASLAHQYQDILCTVDSMHLANLQPLRSPFMNMRSSSKRIMMCMLYVASSASTRMKSGRTMFAPPYTSSKLKRSRSHRRKTLSLLGSTISKMLRFFQLGFPTFYFAIHECQVKPLGPLEFQRVQRVTPVHKSHVLPHASLNQLHRLHCFHENESSNEHRCNAYHYKMDGSIHQVDPHRNQSQSALRLTEQMLFVGELVMKSSLNALLGFVSLPIISTSNDCNCFRNGVNTSLTVAAVHPGS